MNNLQNYIDTEDDHVFPDTVLEIIIIIMSMNFMVSRKFANQSVWMTV